MRVIIRADGNREIAMGHIMRCLSIAEALKASGAEVSFVTAGSETEALIAGRGFQNHILGTDYRSMEKELSVFQTRFREQPAEWILVDSYFVTKAYMQQLGTWAGTAYLDDMGLPVYPVDMLINYNIYAASLPYAKWYAREQIPAPGRILLGCGYAPLRQEFCRGGHSRWQEQVRDVLVTTGGGDRENVAGALCERIAAQMERGLHRGIRYHIVCGPFSEQKRQLAAFAAKHPAFLIHENVTNMSELMKECDIAISAAGSTMYELCSMRLPAVCFYFAENQRQMAEYFHQTTEIKNAGNVTKDRERVLDALLERLKVLEQDSGLRRQIRRQMEGLTDGNGARRIADELAQKWG